MCCGSAAGHPSNEVMHERCIEIVVVVSSLRMEGFQITSGTCPLATISDLD